MLRQYTQTLKSSLNNQSLDQKGFSLVETLISIAIGGLMLSGLLSSIFGYKSLYEKDLSRTQANSGVRSGLDFMGIHLRQAGEKLNSGFPAVLLNDGDGIVPDEIIIRKNILDEIPKICVVANSHHRRFKFARDDRQGCAFADTGDIYDAWSAYRIANGGVVKAYIYDTVDKVGQFFSYGSETIEIDSDTGRETRYFTRESGTGTWGRRYRENISFGFILEEWKFRVDSTSNTLQVVLNEEETNNIISGVEDLEIEIIMNDGSVKTSFGVDDNWKKIQLINVSLKVRATVGHESKTRTFSSSFYPRNILSEDLGL